MTSPAEEEGAGLEGSVRWAPPKPPAGLVIDASVAVKWYVPEPGSAAAVVVLNSGQPLFAPDLLLAELGNILWKKVRRGELTAEETGEIVEQFTTVCPVTLRSDGSLLRIALELAIAFDRTVYESLYLTLALVEGARLVTADERLDNALRGTALESFIQRLGGD